MPEVSVTDIESVNLPSMRSHGMYTICAGAVIVMCYVAAPARSTHTMYTCVVECRHMLLIFQDCEIVYASRHWPLWGQEAGAVVRAFLAELEADTLAAELLQFVHTGRQVMLVRQLEGRLRKLLHHGHACFEKEQIATVQSSLT